MANTFELYKNTFKLDGENTNGTVSRSFVMILLHKDEHLLKTCELNDEVVDLFCFIKIVKQAEHA